MAAVEADEIDAAAEAEGAARGGLVAAPETMAAVRNEAEATSQFLHNGLLLGFAFSILNLLTESFVKRPKFFMHLFKLLI